MFIADELIFREVEQADLPWLRDMRNDPEMSLGWHDARSVQTMQQQERWYASLGPEHQAFIVGNADVRSMGLLRFKLDNVNRAAHMCGMDVLRMHRGNGIAKRMLRAGTAYVFDGLGMHRATCEAMVRNVAAVHTVLQVGYTSEGFMRDYTWSDGRWHTWQRFSMLAGELK